MEIIKSKKDHIQILELVGRLDSNTSKDLEAELTALFINNEYKILLDFARLEYISSAGLRVLLVGVKTINKNEGRLALCSLKEFVHEIFEIAGFTPLFNIYDNRDEALKKLTS